MFPEKFCMKGRHLQPCPVLYFFHLSGEGCWILYMSSSSSSSSSSPPSLLLLIFLILLLLLFSPSSSPALHRNAHRRTSTASLFASSSSQWAVPGLNGELEIAGAAPDLNGEPGLNGELARGAGSAGQPASGVRRTLWIC